MYFQGRDRPRRYGATDAPYIRNRRLTTSAESTITKAGAPAVSNWIATSWDEAAKTITDIASVRPGERPAATGAIPEIMAKGATPTSTGAMAFIPARKAER